MVWNVNQLFEQGEDPYKRKGIWKYTSWSNPFHNAVQEMKVIACESEFLIDIKMLYPGIGEWFFSNFVPSPMELLRKTITGGYRCGFFLGVKFKSPLDIIWRDGSGSRFLGRIVRPFATATFFYWGLNTLWEGLALWQTMIYMGEFCDERNDECVVGGGATQLRIDGSGVGNCAGGLDIWDPNGWHEGLEGSIHVPEGFNTNAYVYFTITSAGVTVDRLRIGLELALGGEGTPPQYWEGSMSSGDQVTVGLNSFGATSTPNDWTLPLEWEGLSKFAPLSFLNITCDRFVVRSNPGPVPEDCPPWQPGLGPTAVS